ncbi:class I glutamine amidotransferase-like protein [Phellopilus nigrolimitatus]|nr:class I glutamine amidotransferase-like protein [Phellopilus nigrolimitatus]
MTTTSKPAPGTKPVKLALLLCDTPAPAVQKTHGTYLDIFRTQLQASNPDVSFPFTLDGYDVVTAQEYPDRDCGIHWAASAYGDVPWIDKLTAWVAETAKTRPEIKLIGICFGHQIIARALGGECVPNGGKWEIGTTEIDLTDVGKEVFKTGKPSIAIQQMHRDHVPAVPPSFHSLGSTPISPVHGLVLPYVSGPPSKISDPANIHILTVQGHPEFTSDIVNAIIDVREKSGAMSAEVVQDGRLRAGREHEGIGAVGRAIWRVLGVDAPA